MDRINVEELMACMHGDQDLCDKLLPLMKDAVKEGEENELMPVFRHPFNMIISGPSQSGKTYFVMQMLKDKQIVPYPDEVYLFYAVYQTLFDDLKRQGVITDSFKGIEGALSLLEESDKQKSKIFIFDDLQTEVVNSREISSLWYPPHECIGHTHMAEHVPSRQPGT